MQPHQPILRLTKADAAKRQLETAIQLWFHDGEPTSIHALAAAAHQILDDLGKIRGGRTMFRSAAYVRPDFRKEFIKRLTDSENFLKHADRDPESILELKPGITPFMMMDAVQTYESQTGEVSPIMKTFRLWMVIQHPQAIREEYRVEWMQRLQLATSQLGKMGKQEFFVLNLGAIALAESRGPSHP